MGRVLKYIQVFIFFSLWVFLPGISVEGQSIINNDSIAKQHYGNDYKWYVENVPFIDLPDNDISTLYYYRWKVVKQHIRNIGDQGLIFTEFAPSVDWEGPFSAISAAAGHHVYESRWLKNPTYTYKYIDFWLSGTGNQFQYSSWLSDAIFNTYKVHGDWQWMKEQLPLMIKDYEGWVALRYDADKGLFWQLPVEDATEFTTSGYMVGNGWFGDAYRPTINAYMYANAKAISKVAELVGDMDLAYQYKAKADCLKSNVQKWLWNPDFNLFADRFTNKYPDLFFQFINGKELNGLVPWAFNLPDDKKNYAEAFENLFDTAVFYAPYGPRTISKQSPYYMLETRTPGELPGECEWNGPSWPYQTSQVLKALANMEHNYKNHDLSKNAFFDIFSIYNKTQQKEGRPYIAENAHPDKGYWIADYQNRSENYFHSTYNDNLLSGLLGIIPSAMDEFVIDPLIPDEWNFFAIDNLWYHGHQIKIVYDKNGCHYKTGNKGLSIWVDGNLILSKTKLKRYVVAIPEYLAVNHEPFRINLAFNNKGKGYPIVKVSSESVAGSAVDLNDGRIWYERYPKNHWVSDVESESVVELNWVAPISITECILHFFVDKDEDIEMPESFKLEYFDGYYWNTIDNCNESCLKEGCGNIISFDSVKAQKIRLTLNHQISKSISLAEIEVY